MDMVLAILISAVVGVLAGGYLGYRYGKSAQDIATKVAGDI